MTINCQYFRKSGGKCAAQCSRGPFNFYKRCILLGDDPRVGSCRIQVRHDTPLPIPKPKAQAWPKRGRVG